MYGNFKQDMEVKASLLSINGMEIPLLYLIPLFIPSTWICEYAKRHELTCTSGKFGAIPLFLFAAK